MARGLARREARLPVHLGVDETSYQKRHEYVTVVIDQDAGTVVHVADGRGREVLGHLFRWLLLGGAPAGGVGRHGHAGGATLPR